MENNGLKVKIVGNNVENFVTDENLVRMINESKIVINFTSPFIANSGAPGLPARIQYNAQCYYIT